MTAVRRIGAIAFCVVATLYAVPAAWTAVDHMNLWRTPTVSEPWSGGKVWSVDTDFLDWARKQIPPGDRFLVIDGTGNPAIAQWTPFQLYPDVVTEDASEADWIVLYGVRSPDAGPEVADFPNETVYADGYSLLGREGVRTDDGGSDAGS